MRGWLVAALLGWAVGCGGDAPDAGDAAAGDGDAGAEVEVAAPRCEGLPRQCQDRISQGQCEAGDGCTWRPGECLGDHDGCAALDAQGCQAEAGCVWSPDFCGGVAAPCDRYLDRARCEVAPGCVWEATP